MSKLGTNELSTRVGDAEVTFETGKLAGQAGGAVVARIGDTILHVTSTGSRAPKEHLDFFPLTVDYEERMYAAGKIPGSFFKREGRPSERAILTCRLVDRPLRPTFDDGLRNEVQILIMTLSADQANPPDVLAINGASLATMLAGIPFDGPVAGIRMAMDRHGAWTPFPSFDHIENEAIFDLVVAGRLNDDSGEIDILMVEAQATPNTVMAVETGATHPTEPVLADALEQAKPYLRQLCDLQNDVVAEAGARDSGSYPLYPAYDERIYAAVKSTVADGLAGVLADDSLDETSRSERSDELRERAVDAVFDDEEASAVEVSDEELERQAKNAFRSLEKTLIRKRVVHDGVRIDGRGPRDIRSLSAEVGVLPRAHGSGLFTRGQTQVLNILTLGMTKEAQRLDTVDPHTEKRYIHHYNFPPFSTGETGFMRGPKRREIGHGALAERAVEAVVPNKDDFPYALRLVSEVLSSNGSTSMASVCASTLSLMDGGVPLHAPVAGIAMGLISQDGHTTTLTDILGAEDAFGDMDFKVAGTSEFVTALQLDTKLAGISANLLGEALAQAKDARLQVLQVMTDEIPAPRPEMNPNAPRVMTEYIPVDKIGEVIGPKGKIINEITEETGADISVDDVDGRGVVQIYSADADSAQAALERVRGIANPVVPKEGERYYGTVVKNADFGSFISLVPGSDGLLHISKLPKPEGRRLNHADEAVSVGDKLWVEVAEVRGDGKFSLVMAEPPAGDAAHAPEPPAPAEPVTAEPVTSGPEPAGAATVGDEPSGGGGRTRSRTRTGRSESGEDSARSRRSEGDRGQPTQEGGQEGGGRRRRRRGGS
jgi:polyribonucleotide nucleotidyltransferase